MFCFWQYNHEYFGKNRQKLASDGTISKCLKAPQIHCCHHTLITPKCTRAAATKHCNLHVYIAEKFFINCKPNLCTLNKRDKLANACRHSNKFLRRNVWISLLYKTSVSESVMWLASVSDHAPDEIELQSALWK